MEALEKIAREAFMLAGLLTVVAGLLYFLWEILWKRLKK
jgi:uncharacterized protein YjeT (DUF2065 family)